MNAIQLLTNRHSEKKLTAPAPTAEQLKTIFQAALQVPDHGKLQPYRFIVIEKEGLLRFEQLLKEAVYELNLGEERLQKATNLAQRAPMVIGVVAKLKQDIKKVPTWEQLVCAGCATYAIQLTANALGFDNVWITGDWVKSQALRKAFYCQEQDQIVALIMLGTSQEKTTRPPKQEDLSQFVQYL